MTAIFDMTRRMTAAAEPDGETINYRSGSSGSADLPPKNAYNV